METQSRAVRGVREPDAEAETMTGESQTVAAHVVVSQSSLPSVEVLGPSSESGTVADVTPAIWPGTFTLD